MLTFRSVVMALGIIGAAVYPGHASASRLAGGQQPSADSLQVPAPARAVAQSDIPRSADDAIATLRGIRMRLNPDPEVVDIESEIPVVVQAVQRLRDDPELAALERLSLRSLQDIAQRWSRYQAQFANRQQSLDRRLQALDTDRNNLRVIREVWEATNRAAIELDYPPTLVERTRDVQGTIDQVEQYRRERLAVVLNLQNVVSRELASVSEVLGQVETARGAASQRLFDSDSPPLWQALFSRGDDVSLGNEVRDSWRENWATFVAYVGANQPRLLIHFLLFAALVALLFDLRRRNAKWTMEHSLEAPARIQSHPVSAGLLVSLLATRWIHPGAPIVVADLAQLAILVPVLRLLPGLVHPSMRRPLFGLAALYALNQIGSLALEQSLLQRLLLLVVTGLALLGLLTLLRQGASLAGSAGNSSAVHRRCATLLTQQDGSRQFESRHSILDVDAGCAPGSLLRRLEIGVFDEGKAADDAGEAPFSAARLDYRSQYE